MNKCMNVSFLCIYKLIVYIVIHSSHLCVVWPKNEYLHSNEVFMRDKITRMIIKYQEATGDEMVNEFPKHISNPIRSCFLLFSNRRQFKVLLAGDGL